MCQLEGSDHGGRDSAAELALAGTIDVQAVERLLQPAGFGANPPFDGLNYTPRRKTVNGFFRDPPALHISAKRTQRMRHSAPSTFRIPADLMLWALQRITTPGDLTLFRVGSYTAKSLLAMAR